MRIVFMGTPEFAAKSLGRLYSDGHDIVGVFTQVDKPRNRGMKKSFSPVKELAISFDTPVYQPTNLRDDRIVNTIKELQCDLITVVAYGKMLPKEILDIPPLGCINIHGSILPKYRGPSPIQHALINGEKETGVTSMYISEEMDAGDIILVKRTTIGEEETSLDLFERLSILGAELLSETIITISGNSVKRITQNHCEATYAPLLSKEMSPIDWNENAKTIKNLVRGLVPWPIATMELEGKVLKVFKVEVTGISSEKKPGSIISSGKSGLEVACADGSVNVKEVQAPGGKRMHAAEYIRGNPVRIESKD